MAQWTLSNLIDALAEEHGLSKVDASKYVGTLIGAMARHLAEPQAKIRINSFGTFTVRDRAAKTARNPLTGAEVQVPARRAVAFKATPTLLASIQHLHAPAPQPDVRKVPTPPRKVPEQPRKVPPMPKSDTPQPKSTRRAVANGTASVR